MTDPVTGFWDWLTGGQALTPAEAAAMGIPTGLDANGQPLPNYAGVPGLTGEQSQIDTTQEDTAIGNAVAGVFAPVNNALQWGLIAGGSVLVLLLIYEATSRGRH